jgi:ankyrin repeat protein
MLLNKGCDITQPDADGLSSVHYAIRHSRSHIIQLMFEARQEHLSQICVQHDNLGKSMLHHHVESVMCSTEVISILLKVGCYVDKLDANGHSALSQYLMSFHFRIQHDVFRLLFENSGTEGIHWTGRNQQNLLHLLMRQWSDDNVRILEDLINFVDITTKDANGMGIEHHGAIHGAFNKSLTLFLRKRGYLNLHSKDFSGKTPLQYAEEAANRERHQDLFEGRRWLRSLQNLRDGDENY